MAILSLVMAFVFWPLAIVFGHIGLAQIRRTGEEGRGLAVAGLVIGYTALGLLVLWLLFFLIAVGASTSTTDCAARGRPGRELDRQLSPPPVHPHGSRRASRAARRS